MDPFLQDEKKEPTGQTVRVKMKTLDIDKDLKSNFDIIVKQILSQKFKPLCNKKNIKIHQIRKLQRQNAQGSKIKTNTH